jgi:phage terminase large subunit GpA-like protein
VLGETWAETGEAPDWQRLFERREDWAYGAVPIGGLFLTAGADVQKDRIELSIWAWGRGLESWLIDHVVIDGGPGDAATWARLAALLGETWPHASGVRLGLARLGIDTGYEAPAVYAWARRQGWGQVLPLKGVEGFNRSAPVSGPTHVDATEGGVKIRRGARLWTVAVATFKSETYRFLRSAAPADNINVRHPAGYIHLPRGVDAEWVKQLVAEQLVTVKTRRGFTRLEWQKLRERNEVLDCRVYARAAAWIAGADRWHERKWRELELQLNITDPVAAGESPSGLHSQTAPGDLTAATVSAGRLCSAPRRGRQVFRSSYLT